MNLNFMASRVCVQRTLMGHPEPFLTVLRRRAIVVASGLLKSGILNPVVIVKLYKQKFENRANVSFIAVSFKHGF